jgi:hypothetical protein
MWFEKLTGFYEESPDQVRKNLTVEDGVLKSLVNGREYQCGLLEIPSLGELRDRVLNSKIPIGKISVKEVISDVQTLHCDKSNSGSLFQVASQFNLLEMPFHRLHQNREWETMRVIIPRGRHVPSPLEQEPFIATISLM